MQGTIVNQLSQKIYQLGVALKLMVSISQDFGKNNGNFKYFLNNLGQIWDKFETISQIEQQNRF